MDKISLDGTAPAFDNRGFCREATARLGLEARQPPRLPMSEESFDVASLAVYLHMMPAQVAKLAERGKLPGRRVGGNWVFSRPEVSRWLEDRMGLSDDGELATIETNLQRGDGGASMIDFAELLPLAAVAIPLPARTRGSVIDSMCQLAAASGALWDPQKMADAVAAREAMSPTALEQGVAILHPRRPQTSLLSHAVIALGVTSQGIPFGGPGGLTDVFFLLAATSDREYLRILARLSRVVLDPVWLAQLRAAPNAPAARDLVLERNAFIAP